MTIASAEAVAWNERPIALFEGETVGRIHLHYQCLASNPVPITPWGFEGVMGVRVQQDLSTVPTLTPLDDISSDEWMWHEGFGWQQQIFAYRPDTGSEVEITTAPSDGGYRDIKSQRTMTADGALWLQTSTAFMASNQGNHWLQYTIAALVILPA